MIIAATAKFLVMNIVLGKVTYIEVIEKKPDLKEQIDAYIEQQDLVVDKTV